MKGNYPNILQSFGLLVIYIGVSVMIGLFTIDISGSLSTFIGALSTSGITLMLALMMKHAPISYLIVNNRFSRPISYLLAVVFSISLVVVLDPLVYLIPIPDWFKQMMLSIIKKDLFTFLTLAIVAPILEEFLFRKVMLTGLVKNYGVTKGILWSAFFFSLFHLNPWQGISAFAIGIFLGWVYLRTGNIWLCVFVHFFNNTLSFIAFYFAEDPFISLLDYVSTTEFVIIMLISIGCMYFCMRALQQHFAQSVSQICKEDQEETDQARPLET